MKLFLVLLICLLFFIQTAKSVDYYGTVNSYFKSPGIIRLELQASEVFQNQEFWVRATIETNDTSFDAGTFNATIETPSSFLLPNNDLNHSNPLINAGTNYEWITNWTVNSSSSSSDNYTINVTENLFSTKRSVNVTVNPGPALPFNITVATDKSPYSINKTWGDSGNVYTYIFDANGYPYNIDGVCNSTIHYPNGTVTSFVNTSMTHVTTSRGQYTSSSGFQAWKVEGNYTVVTNCTNPQRNNEFIFRISNMYPALFHNVYSTTGSFIARNSDSPQASENVSFQVNITDGDDQPENLTVQFWYSTDLTTWLNKSMVNTTPSTTWNTSLTFTSATTIYYFVNVTDDISVNRTPESGYDNLTWSSAGGPSEPSQTGGPGTRPQEISISNFTIDEDFIKVVLKPGGTERKLIAISNIGDTNLAISVNLRNLENFLVFPGGVSEYTFDLEAGGEKSIQLNFFTSEGQETGVFPGKVVVTGNVIEKIITVIVEVESIEPLFDIDVEIPAKYKEVLPGEDVLVQLIIYNIKGIGRVDADVEYGIKDLEGNVIVSEYETLAVEMQVSVARTLDVPYDIKPGNYVLFAIVKYDDTAGTASDIFRVITEEKIEMETITMASLLVIIFTLIVIIVILSLHKRKHKIYVYRRNNIKIIKDMKKRMRKKKK